MTQRRFDRQGVLALYPQAFFDLFIEAEEPTNTVLDTCTVVSIRGPLEHHAGWWCDSYEAILERVKVACEGPSRTIVLRIDSPGGQLSGCFDAARTIRARCKAAGKRLVSYVEGCACSAGYALASAAETIYTSETAFLGSIGILITRLDATAADAAQGLRYALVASGARKVDGNVHAALSEAELAVMQRECETLAERFFAMVAELRPKLGVDALRALEAGVFHGTAAVENGLADTIASFDEMLAALSSGGSIMAEEEKKEERTAGPIDDAREALERAAEGEGEDAERARKALEILNGADPEDVAEEEEPGEAAAASPPAPAAQKAPAAVSAVSAASLARTVQTLAADVTALKAEKEHLERQTMLAARPDLSKELVAKLSSMPIADARAIVDAIPRPEAPKPAATAVVGGTRGDMNAVAGSSEFSWLDQQMGLATNQGGVKREGNAMIFSVPDRKGGPRAPTATSNGKAGK